MQYRALYAFHLVYYIIFAATTFLPRYFGDLGMGDAQIGMLMSLPAVAGVLTQPLFGTLTDRARLKRTVVILLLAGLTAVCFLMEQARGFAMLLAGMTLFYILHLPIAPAFAAISLEYTRDIGKPYGPIRMVGTVGYQLGAALVGAVLVGSLRGLFSLMGVVLLLSCAIAFLFPPIAGHQHDRPRVRASALLADRHIAALLAMVLIGATTSQFYVSFFSKHLGDLGVSTGMTSVILAVSVALELPLLLFADRLARRTSIWNWLLIGFALNAVRWLGLALFQNVWLLLVFQLPCVSVMACFEFFPALYINRRVPGALQGSAQTALTIVAFGLSKVIGSLLGGFVAGLIGIPAVFAINGAVLIAACALLYRPTRKLIAQEAA